MYRISRTTLTTKEHFCVRYILMRCLMKHWCVDSTVFFFFFGGLVGFCLDILQYLKVAYTLCIPLQILKRASLEETLTSSFCRLHFVHRANQSLSFQRKLHILPFFLTSNSESCTFLTIAQVTSMFWSAI